MKFGKIKYLSLLDLSTSFEEERILIIEPFANALNEVEKNAEKRIRIFSEEIELEEDKIIDEDTGMTSHQLMQGNIDDIAFEYQLQTRAVSTSLIIVAQSYLHSKFQRIVSAHEYFKTNFRANELRDHYFSLGEKIDGVPWAEGVKAASNYVRHFEEWKVKKSKYEKISGEMIRIQLTGLIAQLGNSSQATPQTLMRLGFTEDQVFEKINTIQSDIVKKLKLSDPMEFSRLAKVWLDAVMDDLHNKFDHLD